MFLGARGPKGWPHADRLRLQDHGLGLAVIMFAALAAVVIFALWSFLTRERSSGLCSKWGWGQAHVRVRHHLGWIICRSAHAGRGQPLFSR